MRFLIANTFTDSLAKLTGEEQKAAKTTAFDLQATPSQPGLSFHKVGKSKDPNFWSVRVNLDVRIIVHRTPDSTVLCYVDHHDDAYKWAVRRRLEVHPKTGAAQLVEVRQTVQEITVPRVVETGPEAPPKPLLFTEITDSDLLSCGVPDEWLKDVRNADEDSLFNLVEHLPSEAAEALLELAVGGKPQAAQPLAEPPPFEHSDVQMVAEPAAEYAGAPVSDPFDHPDAQRRFRVMHDVAELERALSYPWEKWAVFLHPVQRQIVEKHFSGPARVFGTAGTGKTVVAVHRAAQLARANPDARVLLTTFSDTLADALRTKLTRLIHNQPRLAERVEVEAINAIGERLYRGHFGSPRIATREQIEALLLNAAGEVEGSDFSPRFLLSEWENVVDAWQLYSWEAYRDVRRLGRKTRLPSERRLVLWSIFERVRKEIQDQGLMTRAGMFGSLAHNLKDRPNPPFDFAIVDEAQDIGVAQLRFLAALGGQRPNGLFFAGDLGQRIFQTPFSWKAMGVEVRGRSQILKLNYRTSHQIRVKADRLLGPEVTDVDGNVEQRRGAVSAFNGPDPVVRLFGAPEQEAEGVANWLKQCQSEGVGARELGVFVRSAEQLDRARKAVAGAGLSFWVLDERGGTGGDRVSISTMHLAKGLEFRAVAVMACDDEVLPLQERIENVADDADLEEVYDTERHLLYVACTRARDHLIITGVEPASEFLDDLLAQSSGAAA